MVSLYSKARSPPSYCCAVLLDPRIVMTYFALFLLNFKLQFNHYEIFKRFNYCDFSQWFSTRSLPKVNNKDDSVNKQRLLVLSIMTPPPSSPTLIQIAHVIVSLAAYVILMIHDTT